MSKFLTSLTANLITKARRVVKDGVEYLVADATLINTAYGILQGSKGPLRYTPEDTKAAVQQWNGVPLTVRHPYDPITNEHLSAATPGVWDRQGIGVVRAASFDDRKLRAEAWFDVERTKRLDPRILNSLEQGKPVSLSTGLFTTNEPAPPDANWNGRSFTHYARQHKPDHLAILPDEKGACDIADGCGVLVNRITANVDGEQERDEHGRWKAKVDETLQHTVGKTTADFDPAVVKHLWDRGDNHKVAAMALVSHGKGKWKLPTSNVTSPKEDGCGDGG